MFINMSFDDKTLTVEIEGSARHYKEICVVFDKDSFAAGQVCPPGLSINMKRFTFIGHSHGTFGKDNDTPQSFFEKLVTHNFPFDTAEEIDLIGCTLGHVKDTPSNTFAMQFSELVNAKHPKIKVRAPTSLITPDKIHSMLVYVYGSGKIHISGLNAEQKAKCDADYQREVKRLTPAVPLTGAAADTHTEHLRAIFRYFILKHSAVVFDAKFTREILEQHPNFQMGSHLKQNDPIQLQAWLEVNNRIGELQSDQKPAVPANPIIAELIALQADLLDSNQKLSDVINAALLKKDLFTRLKQINRLKRLAENQLTVKEFDSAPLSAKQTALLKDAAELNLVEECKALLNDKAKPCLILAKKMEDDKKTEVAAVIRKAYYSETFPPYGRTHAHHAVLHGVSLELATIKAHAGIQFLTKADTMGWTPTLLAASRHDEKMITALVAEGVDAQAELTRTLKLQGNTLAHIAIENDDIRVLEIIRKLNCQAMFDMPNALGHSPVRKLVLHVARQPTKDLVCDSATEACFTVLAEAGTSFVSPDSTGKSPLAEAIELEQWAMVMRMLMHTSITEALPGKTLVAINQNKQKLQLALKHYLRYTTKKEKKQQYFDLALNPNNWLGSTLFRSIASHDEKLFRPAPLPGSQEILDLGKDLNLMEKSTKVPLVSEPERLRTLTP